MASFTETDFNITVILIQQWELTDEGEGAANPFQYFLTTSIVRYVTVRSIRDYTEVLTTSRKQIGT